MLNNAKDAQILIKPIYFGHFLPYFWVKIRSKMGKMHRLYYKTYASITQKKIGRRH